MHYNFIQIKEEKLKNWSINIIHVFDYVKTFKWIVLNFQIILVEASLKDFIVNLIHFGFENTKLALFRPWQQFRETNLTPECTITKDMC